MIKNDCDLTWSNGLVSQAEREIMQGHLGHVVWFTGLSGSGKSTIAHLVEKKLFELGCHAYVLDGDNIRHGLCSDLGFSPKDRKENIRRIGEVSKLFIDAGIIVLAAFISPYKEDRQSVRELIEPGRFLEIYVNCPLRTCIRRDPKGLYYKAISGEIQRFTGVSAPYEPPESPELVIETDKVDQKTASGMVVSRLFQMIFSNVSSSSDSIDFLEANSW